MPRSPLATKALESWRRTHALFLAGRRGGEAEKEAEAREQYFQFQEDVENAWTGRLVDSTETYKAPAAGHFAASAGCASPSGGSGC